VGGGASPPPSLPPPTPPLSSRSEAFDLFDTDGTGAIDAKELKVALRALGFEVSTDEVAAMVATSAPAGASELDFDEFVALVGAKVAARDPVDELRKAFRLFDDDETGRISFANLKRAAKELGEPLTDDELREMIDEADRDGDGEVDEAEFLRLLSKAAAVF